MRLGFALAHGFDVCAAAKLGEPISGARERIGQRFGSHTVLACARMHRIEALLDLLQPLRIKIEALLVIAQHVN